MASLKSGLPHMHQSYPDIAPELFAGKLKGKVAIVTGTSVGIGRSIAKAFAAAGASVAAVARREPELLSLVKEIKEANGIAIPIVADVAAKGASTSIVAQVEKELGPVDILINNAGISRISPLDVEDEDLDIWWRVYEVNVRAPVALMRAVLPSMLKRKTGYLISTGSGVATIDLPVMTAYASSKAALAKFHESLAVELRNTGVKTFVVAPGMVKTELGAPKDAINKAHGDHPGMQAFMKSISDGSFEPSTPEVCADTMVALTADPAYRILTGHYVDATTPLQPVLQEAQKEGKGRLGAERLYLVNIGTL